MPGADLAHLCFLTTCKAPASYFKELMTVPSSPWSDLSEQTFTKTYQDLKSYLGGQSALARLLDLYMLTSALTFPKQGPQWRANWLKTNLDTQEILSLSWAEICEAQWLSAPVVLFQERAYIRYFVLGLLKKTAFPNMWPDWAEPLMDQTTRCSLRLVADSVQDLVKDLRPFCYPLLIPNGQLQIKGESLGLSLAFGFIRLAKGKSWVPGLGASGALARDGSILPVAHITSKCTYARDEGFKCFLAPDQPNPGHNIDGIEVIRIRCLNDLHVLAELFDTARQGETQLLLLALENANILVNNLDCLSPEYISWIRRQHRYQDLLKQASGQDKYFKIMTDKLEKLVDQWALEHATVLMDLVDDKELEHLADITPSNVFRWCSLKLALANHQGDIVEVDKCSDLIERLLDRHKPPNITFLADYYNRRLVI